MIASFKRRDTEAMFKGKRIARFSGFEAVAMRKLALLNVAGKIEDLRIPPGNRLEALKGRRQGQWSIRINMINGGYVLDLRAAMPLMLKLCIITEEVLL